MKKTQKILALIMAVMMVVSCFSMVVMAEEEEQYITLVGAKMLNEYEYVLEFDAPVNFGYMWSTFRRQSGAGNGTNQNAKGPSASYLGEVTTVDGKNYSKTVKITFVNPTNDAAETFNPSTFDWANFGIVIAEYNQNTAEKGDKVGFISPVVVKGVNGELVKANIEGTSDFVWIPTGASDPSGTYPVHLRNEDDIRIIGADVSEDKTTYTLRFSDPVNIGARSFVWFRATGPEIGTGQVFPDSVEYLGKTYTYGGRVYSDTVKLVINPDGGKSEDTGNKTFREASSDLTNYGISFTEYTNNSATHAGYMFPSTITGAYGKMVKGNYTSGGRDFLWVPTYTADTDFAYKVHLNTDGLPYVVSATKLLNGKIKVEFSEPVAYTGGVWDIIMRDRPELGTNQASLAHTNLIVEGETVTVDGVTYGTLITFTPNNHDAIAADGAFGMAICEYNDTAHKYDGVVTAKYIKDVDGNGLMPTYTAKPDPDPAKNNPGMDMCWIPTAAADTTNVYPVHLEVEVLPERVEVATYDELKAALVKYANTTIYVTEDIIGNEGVAYEFDEESGKILVIDDAEGSIIAEYGTGLNGTTAGALIEGSIEGLDVWQPLTVSNKLTIDFQDHKVSGFILGKSGTAYGLFETIAVNSTVKNIKVENVLATATAATPRMGAIVASNYGVLENATVKGAILAASNGGGANIGAAVGYMNSNKTTGEEKYNATIYNVVSDGYVFYHAADKTYPCIGGLVGKVNGGKIVNCVNYANVIQRGTASYGTGGLVGLAEFDAGEITAENKAQKTVTNIYIVNNANYGKLDVTPGMPAGGLIGYADLIWSVNSKLVVANNYNAGKMIGAKSGLIANGQNIHGSLGGGTVVYDFNFDDAKAGNPYEAQLTKYAGTVNRIATQDSALENLNRNAGNFQNVNGEDAYDAWAWKKVNGEIVPDKETALSPVQGATTPELIETEYDPETEIYITGVRVVNPNWLEVTFSEPVKRAEGASFYSGIRYVSLSTGAPVLMWANLDGNDGNEPVQFDSAGVFFAEGKMYMRTSDRAYAVSNNIKDQVNGTAHGDKVDPDLVTFCIEGSSGTIPGYIEEITSLDGTKYLKATAGCAKANGKYDGIYFPITNDYEDGDFVNAIPTEDNVVLESAEIVGPHSLKLNFSEPVQLLEGTRAWLSVRYCKYNSTGKDFGLMTYKEGESNKPCQVGVTITKIECDEDGGFIVNLGNTVNIYDVISGAMWEGEDFVAISIEQYPDMVEDQGSIGFIDNIVSVADPTKKLAASPMKTDVTYNADKDEYGPYDGTYAYILAHEHAFEVENFDEENHWVECICGLIDDDTFETHEFDENDIKCDAENHWIECACGAKYGVTAHEYTKPQKDAENHWANCECGVEGEKTAHEYTKPQKDEENHWANCECGAEGEKTAHDYTEAKSDEATHWLECICGAIDEESVTAHSFDKPQSDADNHWANCECGAEGEKTPHDFATTKYDADNHWNVCECGAIDEESVTAHSFDKPQSNADDHWANCECGAEGEKAPHEYDVPDFDEENHWNKCICGAIDEESVTAHSFDKPQSNADDHWANCECGAEGEKTAHDYTKPQKDAENHWANCECGAEGEKTPHDFATTKYDADNHWNVCECGAIDEESVTAHSFDKPQSNADDHWANCECGAEGEKTAHDYNKPQKDEENHWANCECGAEGEKTAHDYTEVKFDADNHWVECICGLIDDNTVEAHEFDENNLKFDAHHHWNECECGADDGKVVHDYNDGDTCECGAKKYITGDINGNETVDADDAIYLLYNVFFGDEDYPINQPADFNSDNTVDADDAIYLLYNVFFGDENYPLFPEVELQ